MRPKNSLIWGFAIFIVLVGSFYVWSNSDTKLTGAVASGSDVESNCPTGTEAELYSDCVVWEAGGYGDKIGSLQQFSDETARKLCGELTSAYSGC